MVEICGVTPHSRAARAGIMAGDCLTEINGHAISDVLDYRFYLAERTVTLTLRRGTHTGHVTLHKGTYDDIGLQFETPLMDRKQHCRNKCIFCFIDQLPRGLRESLYFKDDDARLSFLHGNYITLTNLTDRDIDRIIEMKFTPINVSVHTTNPELRVRMMRNPRAGEVLAYLRRLADAGIALHGQIVLCRGVNDGEELARTLRDLETYRPAFESLSVVPAGMTRYREGLYPLTPFSADECRQVIRQVEEYAERCLQKYGSRGVYLADELYLAAGLPIPKEEDYEGYPQIENGVGMIRSMQTEFCEAMEEADHSPVRREISVATGVAAYPFIADCAARLCEQHEGLVIHVYEIENRFFGTSITVAGLLTGRDLLEQLQGRPLGETLYIPAATLRVQEDDFLCGMSRTELSQALGVPVLPVENDGAAFAAAMLGEMEEGEGNV